MQTDRWRPGKEARGDGEERLSFPGGSVHTAAAMNLLRICLCLAVLLTVVIL